MSAEQVQDEVKAIGERVKQVTREAELERPRSTVIPLLTAPEEVRCPSYLWSGELDESAPPEEGAALGARITGATVTVRPATTHLATLLAHWPDLLATLRAHLH